ncbi:unnamed protein product, partial [Colletotrichum noveboracense]
EVSLSKHAGQFPDFPSDYEGGVKPLDNAQAAQANGGASVTLQTSWYPFKDDLKLLHIKYLKEIFKEIAFLVDEKQSGVCYYYYDMGFTQANSEKGELTKAIYSNIVNPSAGAFIFDENMSPRYIVKEYSLRTMPDMDILSDFAFFK